jgi:hypothetical protein
VRYEIGRSCGHTEDVQIYGSNVRGERERKAAWLATRPCQRCADGSRTEGRLAEAASAAGQAIAAGLPDLAGTPRQAAWAASIRQQLLDTLRSEVGQAPAYRHAAGDVMAIYLRIAAPVTEARDWINHRDDPRALLRSRMTDGDRAALAALRQHAPGA